MTQRQSTIRNGRRSRRENGRTQEESRTMKQVCMQVQKFYYLTVIVHSLETAFQKTLFLRPSMTNPIPTLPTLFSSFALSHELSFRVETFRN